MTTVTAKKKKTAKKTPARKSSPGPAVGTQAPAFRLPDGEGKTHSLKDYLGKWVILYFYPKDMTPGCTQEACDFQGHLPQLKKKGAVVLGVSKDSPERHQKFSEKYGLRFPLLSDESGEVCEKYGVWQEKSLYGKKFMGIVRSTFLIDPQGKIREVYSKVKVKDHAKEVVGRIN